jgi:hypothetical protein
VRSGKLKVQTDDDFATVYVHDIDVTETLCTFHVVVSVIAKDRNCNQKSFNFMTKYVWITDRVSRD